MTSLSTVACRQCGGKFTPAPRAGRNSGRRRSVSPPSAVSNAEFCSSRCRQANYRWRHSQRLSAVTSEGEKPRQGPGVLSAVTAPLQDIETTSEFSTKNHVARLPKGIVPDAKYPGMYRLLLPGGGLSDMVNLTRANDALRALTERKAM
jgi:hypothetical protein